MKYEEITEKIIKAFYEVYNKLGGGFLERVYENAIMVELKEMGVEFDNQCPVKIGYKGVIVGEYVADFIVENKVIVELKALVNLSSVEEGQLLNYLSATGIGVGLLLNFGDKPQVRRMVN